MTREINFLFFFFQDSLTKFIASAPTEKILDALLEKLTLAVFEY